MKLSAKEVAKRAAASPGWKVDGQAIRRLYTFTSFADAITFVTRLAFDAEKADHHPDFQISYRKVTVIWTTHSDSGLSAMDFDGARQSDMIAARMMAPVTD